MNDHQRAFIRAARRLLYGMGRMDIAPLCGDPSPDELSICLKPAGHDGDHSSLNIAVWRTERGKDLPKAEA